MEQIIIDKDDLDRVIFGEGVFVSFEANTKSYRRNDKGELLKDKNGKTVLGERQFTQTIEVDLSGETLNRVLASYGKDKRIVLQNGMLRYQTDKWFEENPVVKIKAVEQFVSRKPAKDAELVEKMAKDSPEKLLKILEEKGLLGLIERVKNK